MAGLDVVYIPTDKDGSVSVEEFKKKVALRVCVGHFLFTELLGAGNQTMIDATGEC